MELADTTAWSKAQHAPADVAAEFRQLLVGGELACCNQVKLELLMMARNAAEIDERSAQLAALQWCPIDEAVWARAFDVLRLLADQQPVGHRRIKPADALIAASAELAGVGVLHYDQDFDTIASVTGQATRWLAPRGSL